MKFLKAWAKNQYFGNLCHKLFIIDSKDAEINLKTSLPLSLLPAVPIFRRPKTQPRRTGATIRQTGGCPGARAS